MNDLQGQASLDALLPQARPMILLSGYQPADDPNTAVAFVEVTPESPFYDHAIQGVPSCVALEYMAQTMALCVGTIRRAQGLAPQVGYVLGTRRLDLRVPKFVCGVRYRVETVCTFQDCEFGSFDCKIGDEAGGLVAFATLTAYQAAES